MGCKREPAASGGGVGRAAAVTVTGVKRMAAISVVVVSMAGKRRLSEVMAELQSLAKWQVVAGPSVSERWDVQTRWSSL